MEPQGQQTLPVTMTLSKMIDELSKGFAEGNARCLTRATMMSAESEIVDENSDIEGLKAKKNAYMKEVEIMRDDWLKAMESFYAIQEHLLTMCYIASPCSANLTPSHNIQGSFGLPVLLTKMMEELGQRIAKEKATRLTGKSTLVVDPQVDNEMSDVEVLKAENANLKAQLKELGDGWMNMNATFYAFVYNLVNLGLIVAPSEGIPSQK